MFDVSCLFLIVVVWLLLLSCRCPLLLCDGYCWLFVVGCCLLFWCWSSVVNVWLLFADCCLTFVVV